MSTPTPSQPDPAGSFSIENGPEVVVRAGKYYVCSSCGTLVEIPADVIGQLVIVVKPEPPVETPSEESSKTKPTASAAADDQAKPSPGPSAHAAHGSQASMGTTPLPSKTKQHHPSRPSRPKQPGRVSFVGQTIDGLVVPSAEQLDRAFAWVTFHLTVLDRQGAEIKRLQKVIKKRCRPKRCGPPVHDPPGEMRADESSASKKDTAQERGPP